MAHVDLEQLYEGSRSEAVKKAWKTRKGGASSNVNGRILGGRYVHPGSLDKAYEEAAYDASDATNRADDSGKSSHHRRASVLHKKALKRAEDQLKSLKKQGGVSADKLAQVSSMIEHHKDSHEFHSKRASRPDREENPW